MPLHIMTVGSKYVTPAGEGSEVLLLTSYEMLLTYSLSYALEFLSYVWTNLKIWYAREIKIKGQLLSFGQERPYIVKQQVDQKTTNYSPCPIYKTQMWNVDHFLCLCFLIVNCEEIDNNMVLFYAFLCILFCYYCCHKDWNNKLLFLHSIFI